MKRALYGACLAFSALLCVVAQDRPKTPPQQPSEVVLQATSGAKLVLGMGAPQASGVDGVTVEQDFSAVLRRDLEDSGLFSLVKENAPASTGPASYKAWRDAGADWLLTMKVDVGAESSLDAQVIDTKAQKQVQAKRFQGPVPLRKMAHALADEMVRWLTGESGVSASRFLFIRQTAPLVKELFQMDRDGAGVVQLTSFGSLTLAPTVASDGRVAVVTYKVGSPEIWGQRKAGATFERLYPQSGETAVLVSSPAWSPDGRKLAFVQGDRRGNTDIMVLDLASGRARRLTDGMGINTEPCWNPSGTQLAFTSDREGGPQVFLMQEDGSGLRRLTSEGGYNASPAWSPSGSMIAYVSRFEGKFDLFIYKLGEGKAYQITTGVSTSESPAWSPDERRLVFTSNRAGGLQIYTTDLSGRQVERVSALYPCQSPKWTRAR